MYVALLKGFVCVLPVYIDFDGIRISVSLLDSWSSEVI